MRADDIGVFQVFAGSPARAAGLPYIAVPSWLDYSVPFGGSLVCDVTRVELSRRCIR